MQNRKIDVSQSNNSKLSVQVSNDLTVQIITNSPHEFLMDNKAVSEGYGCSIESIRGNLYQHKDELKENTHYLRGVRISNGDPSNKIYWTKAGIIRLGFFIKSERAKLFRDWAENVILEVSSKPALPTVSKRKHNRITPDRMISILEDVCMIPDKELRESLLAKLKGGSHE